MESYFTKKLRLIQAYIAFSSSLEDEEELVDCEVDSLTEVSDLPDSESEDDEDPELDDEVLEDDPEALEDLDDDDELDADDLLASVKIKIFFYIIKSLLRRK